MTQVHEGGSSRHTHALSRSRGPMSQRSQPKNASRMSWWKQSWWKHIAAVLVGVLGVGLIGGAVIVQVEHLRFEPVLSGSMRPGVQPGDLVVLKPVPVKQLRVGEVIAYLPPRQTVPIMHRIVSINANGIITKGDANRVADPWGRVKPQSSSVEHLVGVIPKIGELATTKRQLLGIIGAALLLALALVIFSSGRKSDPTDGDAESDAGAGAHELIDAATSDAEPSDAATNGDEHERVDAEISGIEHHTVGAGTGATNRRPMPYRQLA